MATAIFKKYSFAMVLLFVLTISLFTQKSFEVALNEVENEKVAFWQILEDAVQSDVSDAADFEDDSAGDDEIEDESDYKDFNERTVDYPDMRAALHKICKVVSHKVSLTSNKHEYSLNHYNNLTCEETTDKPFMMSPPHTNEYCVIIHHPHERFDCRTKYTHAPIFRRHRGKHFWEKTIHKVGVGCGCSVGLKYM